MKSRVICLVLFSALTGACSGPAGPEGDFTLGLPGDSPVFTFSAWFDGHGSKPAPDLRVEGGVGEISLQGPIGTRVPCYDVQGHVEQAGAEVHFTVSAVEQPVEVCAQVLATFGYRGALRELPPGSYQVRVTHSVDHHASQVLQTSVSVR